MTQELRLLGMPNAPVKDADVLILPIPYERTVSYKPGTAEAPRAILAATDQLEFFDEDANWSPFKHIRLCVLPEFTDTPSLVDSVWHHSLTDHASHLPSQKLLISLGGEHSLTPSLVDARMKAPGTVLFFDAHADMRMSYEGSFYSHACPVRRLLEQGHDIVMIGIRSIFESEMDLVHQEPRLTLFKDRVLSRNGQWASLLQKMRDLQGVVYISIDMDVFNPSEVPGVGTPQPGGLSWHQMIDVFEVLFANPAIELSGVDIVELVPEPSHVSEMTAAKLLHKIISFWGKSKGFQSKPEMGNQMYVNYE